MTKQIIIENIIDIEIDGNCIKDGMYCLHDVTLIYNNNGIEVIKSTILNFLDIKYILIYLNKKNSHFN